jgi:putative DNA primase/helicase
MSDINDPLGDEWLEPVSTGKKSRKRQPELMISPEDLTEGDTGVDLELAFQPMNDDGNANRLVRRYGEDLMFVKNVGWFAWTGARWDRERGDAEFIKRGHQLSRAMRGEYKALKEKGKDYDDVAGRLYVWGVQSGNTARINSMMTAAAPYLSQPVEVLDADPYLVASETCTVELGAITEYRDNKREDRITRMLGVKYATGSYCPRFEKFLERVMPDPEMRAYLQRAMGYSLTASTREQCFFIHFGHGNNGKSTFMNCMRKVFGTYAMNSPISTFLAKNFAGGGGDASPDLARLPGARLVLAAEPPEGARLDEAKIKDMTSGETMTVRHLNQGFFEFQPVFKAHISTNHRPVIRGTDRGIWRRIRLIPWPMSISKEEVDTSLEAKLMEEAEGILQWVLTGAEEWFALQGLHPPAAALAAVEDYRADSDSVGEFLLAKCKVEPDKDDCRVSAKDLYKRYKEWSDENALEPLTGKTFGVKLAGRGIGKKKSGGNIFYTGISVFRDEFLPADPPAYGEPGYDGPADP